MYHGTYCNTADSCEERGKHGVSIGALRRCVAASARVGGARIPCKSLQRVPDVARQWSRKYDTTFYSCSEETAIVWFAVQAHLTP